jgi:hypothetical protein
MTSYRDTQMISTDPVLGAAVAVYDELADAYGLVKKPGGGCGIPVADGGRVSHKQGCGCVRSYLRGRVAVCRMAAMASTVSRCPAATLITRS